MANRCIGIWRDGSFGEIQLASLCLRVGIALLPAHLDDFPVKSRLLTEFSNDTLCMQPEYSGYNTRAVESHDLEVSGCQALIDLPLPGSNSQVGASANGGLKEKLGIAFKESIPVLSRNSQFSFQRSQPPHHPVSPPLTHRRQREP